MRDFTPATEQATKEIAGALAADPPWLPPWLLYDARGSELFEQICETDDYYLTRTEIGILHDNIAEISARIGPAALLIEYGSGSGEKTRLLLDHLVDPVAYVPIEISRDALEASVSKLVREHPGLQVLPVCADFNRPYELPQTARPERQRVVFFPGSSIGNFAPADARDFLEHMSEACGPDGGLLIGVDLHKDAPTLERAYNDSDGVTARFELNVLARLRDEFGVDVDPREFDYECLYSSERMRVEMYLRARSDQQLQVGATEIEFAAGTRIRTEYSYKYTPASFARLCAGAHLRVEQSWTDPQQRFSVAYLVPESATRPRS